MIDHERPEIMLTADENSLIWYELSPANVWVKALEISMLAEV